MGRIFNWAAPILLCLALYWYGLFAWFQRDDFIWLSLRPSIHGWKDMGWALFAPMAQGTIRIWSERIFFMVGSGIFGVHAFPLRIAVFLTQFLNLFLIRRIAVKMTGDGAVGFWVPVLWIVNSALAAPMSWTSAYNEILCASFLLGAFRLLLRYVETGDRRYCIAQWVVFLLGFGAKETNVVYPALALAYALAVNRRYVRGVIPMFGVSAAFTALHVWVSPVLEHSPYRISFGRILPTLWTYWKDAVGPSRLNVIGVWPSHGRSALTVILMLGLAVLLAAKIREKQWVVVVFPIWFLAAIAPFLLIPDLVLPLYLTMPTIGLAMWGAWALVTGWRSGAVWRIAAVLVAGIYFGVSIPVTMAESRSIYARSQESRKFVQGVVKEARQRTVVLPEVSNETFWDVLLYRPFAAYDLHDVYLAPEARQKIRGTVDPRLMEMYTEPSEVPQR